MDAYYQSLYDTPLLTPAEERELGRRSLAGDREARNKLVQHNLRLVHGYVRSNCQGFPLDPEDLISEGITGLIRAAEKYDPSKGFRFSTYATWWIRQAVTRAAADKGYSIRLPVHAHEKLRRIIAASRRLVVELEREPTHEEIAVATDLPLDLVRDLLLVKERQPVALEAFLNDAGEIAWEPAAPDGEPTLDELHGEELRALVDTLPERQRVVIRLLYGLGLDQPRTLEEIADKLGCSREQVRIELRKGLRQLRGLADTSPAQEASSSATSSS